MEGKGCSVSQERWNHEGESVRVWWGHHGKPRIDRGEKGKINRGKRNTERKVLSSRSPSVVEPSHKGTKGVLLGKGKKRSRKKGDTRFQSELRERTTPITERPAWSLFKKERNSSSRKKKKNVGS